MEEHPHRFRLLRRECIRLAIGQGLLLVRH
jgi:hypothetical protein